MVLVKPLLDAVMVKDSEGERCFASPPCTNQSDGGDSLTKALYKSKTVNPMVFVITDLIGV